MSHDETVITLAALLALPEYSCSLPTGTTIGKRWRCATRYREPDTTDWLIGEFVEHPDADKVGIVWTWAVRAPGEPFRGRLK